MTNLSASTNPVSPSEQEQAFTDLPVRILRLKQVVDRTGLSRSTIYDRINPNSKRYDESFPKPIKLSCGKEGSGAVGWLESAVNRWIKQCCQPDMQPSSS